MFSRSALLALLAFLAVMLVRVMLALLAVVLVMILALLAVVLVMILALLAVVLVMILALLAVMLVSVRFWFCACAPAIRASLVIPSRNRLPRLAMTFGCCANLAFAPASVATFPIFAPFELLGHWARFALKFRGTGRVPTGIPIRGTSRTSAFASFASIPILALLKLLSLLTPASGCFAYCSCARESVAFPCIQSFFEPLGFGT